MLKWLGWTLAILVALVVVVVGLERYAAESGEVVVLHARDATGEVVTTRLWVVDHEGQQYLRVGADGSGWYSRLTANPDIQLARDGAPEPYRAVPEPAASEAINRLMQAKYGWRDSVIGAMVGGRDGSIPIRLDPR
jgi:hypothetical protein